MALPPAFLGSPGRAPLTRCVSLPLCSLPQLKPCETLSGPASHIISVPSSGQNKTLGILCVIHAVPQQQMVPSRLNIDATEKLARAVESHPSGDIWC